MSEPTSRLNLIQRAMQQATLKRSEPAGPDDAAEERREPVMELQDKAAAHQPHVVVEQPPKRVNGQASAAPMAQPQQRTAQGLRLNMQKLKAARMITPDSRASVTYNEFRSIKRKLLPLTRDADTKSTSKNIVMITSALAGEGKTYTALNLAICLAAEKNLEVILVDGDVVRSSIAEFFEGAPEQGLLDLLTGRRQQIDEVLQRCADLPNLHVLFAGRHDDTSPELLASQRMAEVCSALSRRFRDSIVVIDAPPVLATAEPSALAMHVHHLIMVVAAGQVARHHVEEALAGVAACPSISLVFNKSPEWQRPTPYPYYYNYAEK